MNESQPRTIYEESSAESSVDPNANKELTESPRRGTNLNKAGISHLRTNSDNLVHYTPVEIGPGNNFPVTSSSNLTDANFTNAPSSANTQYSAIVSRQTPTDSSEYMVMTPNSGNTSASSSLKRHSSLPVDHPIAGGAVGRLALLGLSEESIRRTAAGGAGSSTATITSPSSQSSYNPLEDIEEQQTLPVQPASSASQSGSAYCVMSPLSSVSKGIPIGGRRSNSTNVDDDEYMSMSPAGVAAAAGSASPAAVATTGTPTSATSPLVSGVGNRHNMAIPLQESGGSKQGYELMSPVNIDQEKLRRISEEDSGTEQRSGQSAIDRLNGGSTGARPKYGARSCGSKRSSFCSDVGGDIEDHFHQLQQNHPAFEHEREQEISSRPEYVAMDYSHSNANPGSAAAIPIPAGAVGRMSPAAQARCSRELRTQSETRDSLQIFTSNPRPSRTCVRTMMKKTILPPPAPCPSEPTRYQQRAELQPHLTPPSLHEVGPVP